MKRITDNLLTFVKKFWRGLNFLRKLTFNIIFLSLIFTVIILLFNLPGPEVPESAALVVAPVGTIVEQVNYGMQSSFRRFTGLQKKSETLLKDLLDAIKFAKKDPRLKVIFLDLSRMGPTGLSRLQDLREQLIEFKKSGKKIIAYSDSYFQSNYYLAAHADQVCMHHMGNILIKGYEVFKPYYKEGIDRLEIDLNILRSGKFKSAVEPFFRNSMSNEAKEANIKWLSVLWRAYLQDIGQARNIEPDDLQKSIDGFPDQIKIVSGNMAQLSLNMGLIDKAVTRDEIRDELIKITGKEEKTSSYYKIDYIDYLDAINEDRFGQDADGDVVAVIVAKGTILNGVQPAGTIGGDSTSALIRKARNDQNVKAVVLRVDSHGGSAFASELIRREFELTKEQGKPVVVSMGSVAASGGYWISLCADEIWARPTTITGSIGVIGMFPTYQRLLRTRLGIRVDGIGTTKLAGALHPGRELDHNVKESVKELVENVYNQFITKAAGARNMSVNQMHKIAQGRVWSGLDAKRLGLIDKLGGLEEALDSAAKLANLGDNYKVQYIGPEPKLKDRILAGLLTHIYKIVGSDYADSLSPVASLTQFLSDEVLIFSKFNDPNGVYAYCPYNAD
jgi:protease IV